MSTEPVRQAVHDLNNLLTVIGSHAALLADTMVGDDQAARDLQQIREAARQATSVVQQLADSLN